MKTSQELLSSVLKTTQMGQVGIRSVLDTTLNPELRQALVQQLKEYDGIETEAHNIASQRGWELKELDSAVRMMSNMVCRMKLTGADATSKISEMMIQGNTKGLVKGLRNLHLSDRKDSRVETLSQKLIDTETNNIRQMRPFL